ncbi:MAG: hypothetical protein F6K42_23210 [Leptolyngbya sp. SIO1D8]|nr:hypothetical protein [Leptolyngbya sp. SIO1D8]
MTSAFSSRRIPSATLKYLSIFLVVSNLSLTASAQSSFTPQSSTRLETSLAAEPYILGAGDQVGIEVFRVPEYSGEYEVLVDGALSLPMVGQVFVLGLTLEQAQERISQAYSIRLRRPIINVRLLSPRPLRIGIAGEVSHPGSYTLAREGTQFPSLVAALEEEFESSSLLGTEKALGVAGLFNRCWVC